MGVGWQLDGIPRHWKQGLEVVELAAARQLKARQPGMRCATYVLGVYLELLFAGRRNM